MARQIPSPLLIDQDQLLANLEQIWAAAQRTGFRVLLDQTAFPAWPLYPMLGLYLSGTVAANAALAEQGLRHHGPGQPRRGRWADSARRLQTCCPGAHPHDLLHPGPVGAAWTEGPGTEDSLLPASVGPGRCAAPESLWRNCPTRCPMGSAAFSFS